LTSKWTNTLNMSKKVTHCEVRQIVNLKFMISFMSRGEVPSNSMHHALNICNTQTYKVQAPVCRGE